MWTEQAETEEGCADRLGQEAGDSLSGMKSGGLRGLGCCTGRASCLMPGVWVDMAGWKGCMWPRRNLWFQR